MQKLIVLKKIKLAMIWDVGVVFVELKLARQKLIVQKLVMLFMEFFLLLAVTIASVNTAHHKPLHEFVYMSKCEIKTFLCQSKNLFIPKTIQIISKHQSCKNSENFRYVCKCRYVGGVIKQIFFRQCTNKVDLLGL